MTLLGDREKKKNRTWTSQIGKHKKKKKKKKRKNLASSPQGNGERGGKTCGLRA